MDKKIYIDKKNAKVMGVSAGLADMFYLDIGTVRVLTFLFCLLTVVGVIAYIAMGAILPDKKDIPKELRLKKRLFNNSEKFKLYKSKTDKYIAGVCGGIAEILKIDSSIVRILFLISLIFDGLGGWIYLILWIALPDEGEALPERTSRPVRPNRPRRPIKDVTETVEEVEDPVMEDGFIDGDYDLDDEEEIVDSLDDELIEDIDLEDDEEF